MTAQHYTDLSTAMAAYLADPSAEACLSCGGDMRLIRQATNTLSYCLVMRVMKMGSRIPGHDKT